MAREHSASSGVAPQVKPAVAPRGYSQGYSQGYSRVLRGWVLKGVLTGYVVNVLLPAALCFGALFLVEVHGRVLKGTRMGY